MRLLKLCLVKGRIEMKKAITSEQFKCLTGKEMLKVTAHAEMHPGNMLCWGSLLEDHMNIGAMIEGIGEQFKGISVQNNTYHVDLKDFSATKDTELCDAIWKALCRSKGIEISENSRPREKFDFD